MELAAEPFMNGRYADAHIQQYEGACAACPYLSSGDVKMDLAKTTLPLLAVVALLVFAVSSSFYLSTLYNEFRNQNVEIVRRLDRIEDTLGKILGNWQSGVLRKGRTADKG
jgi:hypothetical protein